MRHPLVFALLLPSIVDAQTTQLKGSAAKDYVDREFTSREVMRLITAIDLGCAVVVGKGENDAHVWFLADELTNRPDRARLVIQPEDDIAPDEVLEHMATMWVGLPVFIAPQSEISYRCPAGKYISIETVNTSK